MKRSALVWIAAMTAATIVAAVVVGPGGAAWPWSARGDALDARIVWQVRAPRVALGFLAGAALATAGMAFQAVFRNALATPYTLGVSAGASLGTALYVHAGAAAAVAGLPGQVAASLAGAAAALALVYGLGRAAGGFAPATLLLAGVAVSFLCTSIILALQYIGDVTTAFRIGRWLVGGLEVVGFAPVLRVLPFAAVGIAALGAISRELDLVAVGDDSAAFRGVSVGTVNRVVFGAASMMVGGVVATCGPIGFVGLVVPHIGRILIGPGHRALLPFCLLAGGAFLVVCDTVGRTVAAPVEVPVGIVTALVGGPFFLALLVRGQPHR